MKIPRDEYYKHAVELLTEWKEAPTEDHKLQLVESIAEDEDLAVLERLIQLAIVGAHVESACKEAHTIKEILDNCDLGEKRV